MACNCLKARRVKAPPRNVCEVLGMGTPLTVLMDDGALRFVVDAPGGPADLATSLGGCKTTTGTRLAEMVLRLAGLVQTSPAMAIVGRKLPMLMIRDQLAKMPRKA